MPGLGEQVAGDVPAGPAERDGCALQLVQQAGQQAAELGVGGVTPQPGGLVGAAAELVQGCGLGGRRLRQTGPEQGVAQRGNGQVGGGGVGVVGRERAAEEVVLADAECLGEGLEHRVAVDGEASALDGAQPVGVAADGFGELRPGEAAGLPVQGDAAAWCERSVHGCSRGRCPPQARPCGPNVGAAAARLDWVHRGRSPQRNRHGGTV